MKIIAWTTSYWDNVGHAKRPELSHPIFGLHAWYSRVQYLFSPYHTFIACGTESLPEYSPLGDLVPVINAGIPVGKAYDRSQHQYWSCAATAAMAYALNKPDWEVMVFLDTDALVGDVNFKTLLKEFLRRPEIIMTASWCGCPSGPLFALKRAGAIRFLHQRCQGNIALRGVNPELILAEEELLKLYSDSWWNPWPNCGNVRQDFSVNPNDPSPLRSLHWPFIRQPHPDVIKPYLDTQWSRVTPV